MTTSTPRQAHHHGDLRRALVQAGIDMLEDGENFSLRGVARRVGVSQTAPYRHFADKDHLEAAMAAHGFTTLKEQLVAAIDNAAAGQTTHRVGDPGAMLGDVVVSYARFAVENPAMYRLMFGQPCGELDERLAASAEVFTLIENLARDTYPPADHPAVDAHAMATAGWALAHGLASLQLDGKLGAETPEALEMRVRETVAALIGVQAASQ